MRRVVDAIFCRNRNGWSWRALLHDFPPWRTVDNEFKWWKWNRTFAWLGRCRVHSWDDERLAESSEAQVEISMIR